MNTVQETILFRTSAASDIQQSNGEITVAGTTATKKTRISSINQLFYHAEVVQVVTIGGTSYTPTGSTPYTVEVGDVTRRVNGAQEQLKRYTYVTPATITDLGSTAALQREAISVALVTQINSDTSNFVLATTSGSGNGFTIADDAGYYPPFSQTQRNRNGASTVRPCQNPDDSGYLSTNVSITTAAVYSSGVGADLLASIPVIDALYGGLLSGYLLGLMNGVAPKTAAGLPAVSGQNYDTFIICSLTNANAHNQRGQLALVPKMQAVFVDNGTGSSTTNLTGFKAFERVMHKLMVQQYQDDSCTTQEFFDKGFLMQPNPGVSPYTGTLAGTADVLDYFETPYGILTHTNIGTQTIFAPILNDLGLLIDQDDTATEGAEYAVNALALGDQSFVVGKTPFSVGGRYVMGDYTDAAFMIGFRKKAVYAAITNNYTDFATIGNGSSAAGTTWINGDLFVTRANINSGTTLQTISAIAPADAVSVFVQVKVALDGTVTAFVNGVSYPIYSLGTTQMVFDAGDEMIPFFRITNIASGDPACVISQFFAVSNDNLIL